MHLLFLVSCLFLSRSASTDETAEEVVVGHAEEDRVGEPSPTETVTSEADSVPVMEEDTSTPTTTDEEEVVSLDAAEEASTEADREVVVDEVLEEPVEEEEADEDGAVVDLDDADDAGSEQAEVEASEEAEVEASDEADVEATIASVAAVTEPSSTGVESSSDTVEEPVAAETVEAAATTEVQEETADAHTAAASEEEADVSENTAADQTTATAETPQTGPFVDIFGPSLLSLEMLDDNSAQIKTHPTNEALRGKKVIGLYFSADWCGPCRQFTPELVSFYDKMNKRKGKEGQFEIVWVSRSRDVEKWGQFFTHMSWLAMPPQDAMGQQGSMLSEKYKVKGIPHLVLLDESGNVITYDARNKIPADRSGVGFPWRNPLISAYMTLIPKSLRLMIKTNLMEMRHKFILTAKGALGIKVVQKV